MQGSNAFKSLRKLRKEVNEDLKDDRLDAVLALAEVRAVPDHLVPLIEQHGGDDADLLLEATKLLVQLTMPEQPAEHVKLCKEALARSPTAMAIIASQAHGPLSIDSAKRDEKNKLLLELLLWLTRNLLSCRGDAAVDGALVQVLQHESVLDVCLHLGEHVKHKGNREWNLVLLEIFFHLFRVTTPEDLAFQTGGTPPRDRSAENDAAGNERQARARATEGALDRLWAEKQANKAAAARSMSSRHSRFAFGTVYSVQTESGATKLRASLKPQSVRCVCARARACIRERLT